MAELRAKLVRMLAVYRRGPLTGQEPIGYVSLQTADQWVKDGAANPIFGYKAIQLCINLEPALQRSIAMGPSVVEGNAFGYKDCKALVAAWETAVVPVATI